MKNTYYLKFEKGLNTKYKIAIYLFSAALVISLIFTIFFSSSISKTFTLFNLNPNKPNVSISSTLDSVHLDANLKPTDAAASTYIYNDFNFINLKANPLSTSKKLEIDAEFAVTSGISAVEFYLDSPGSSSQLIYSRFLQSLKWNYISDSNIGIWQKDSQYSNINDIFVSTSDYNIHKKALVVNLNLITNIKIESYSAASNLNSVFFPVRGNFKAAFYLGKNEPLKLNLYKRDLNLYDGADTVNVKIYDIERNLIVQYNIEDDGIVYPSDISKNLQKLSVEKESLSEGVYYLEVSQNDSIIERFDMTMNKFMFLDDLFLANNQAYTPNYAPLDFAVDTKVLTAYPIHNYAFQDLQYNDKTVSLISTSEPAIITLDPEASFTNFTTEKGDIYLNMKGTIAFDDSYFFNLNPVITYNSYDTSNVNDLDFVFADYVPIELDSNGFYARHISIDIPSELQGKDLSFVVKLKKSGENDGLLIKQIKFTY